MPDMQIAVCPTHGTVDAILWKGDLVCPDAQCHRTCSLATCSVCGSSELAVLDGAGRGHCIDHLPEEWTPLFQQREVSS